MAFPIDETHLIAMFTQDILYGVYLLTLAFCLRALVFDGNKRRAQIKWLFVWICLFMWLLASMSISLELHQILEAFVWTREECGTGQETVFITNNWRSVLSIGNVLTVVLTADAVLMYRCYVTCGSRKLTIIVPGLLWLATLAATIMILVRSAVLHKYPLINTPELRPFVIFHLAVTAAQNITTTGIMLFQIWMVDSSVIGIRTYRNNTLRSVMRIMLESGALYTFTAFVTLLSAVSESNSSYVSCSVFLQMTGISFNLIIIRYDAALRNVRIFNVQNSTLQGTDTALTALPSSFGSNNSRDHKEKGKGAMGLSTMVSTNTAHTWQVRTADGSMGTGRQSEETSATAGV